MRKSLIRTAYAGLIFNTIFVSLLATLLAETLKVITEKFEDHLFEKGQHLSLWLIFFPALGLTAIFVLKKYFFGNKANRGIKDIYHTLENRRDELPVLKIISHAVNGFLTVIFGGSTGIEVSTVVATATIGATAHRKMDIANKYKTEIVAAAVAAGITTLFGSPLAGVFFAMEAISKKTSKTIAVSAILSALISMFCLHLIGGKPIFYLHPKPWPYRALPYLVCLSIVAGLVAVYFTRLCLFIKHFFANIKNNWIRVGVGSAIIGIAIFVLPQLYGDSYKVIANFMMGTDSLKFSISFIWLLLSLIVFKPLIASVTLGAGGDGGVFAPSLVIGALLGLVFALTFNHYLGTHLILINFMIVGMAAVLSGSIHAPFTALALVCSFSGTTVIFIPIMIGCFIAKYTAKILCQHTVYSYQG
jgi:CIC family chloride channel protein